MENYLLNVEHPQGGSKAKFFIETLGYKPSQGELLHNNIAKSIINKIPDKVEHTEFGTKLTFRVPLKGGGGRVWFANIIAVVVQSDTGTSIYKIITVYPDKKG